MKHAEAMETGDLFTILEVLNSYLELVTAWAGVRENLQAGPICWRRQDK
jgi:hypothetical protein